MDAGPALVAMTDVQRRLVAHRPPTVARGASKQLREHRRSPAGAVTLDGAVGDVAAAELLGKRAGDLGRAVRLEGHAAAGAVAVEAVADVEVLLEVVAQREVEEGALRRRQLHRRRQAALDHGYVA